MSEKLNNDILDNVTGDSCLGFSNPGALMQYNAHMKRHENAENQ